MHFFFFADEAEWCFFFFLHFFFAVTAWPGPALAAPVPKLTVSATRAMSATPSETKRRAEFPVCIKSSL